MQTMNGIAFVLLLEYVAVVSTKEESPTTTKGSAGPSATRLYIY